MPFVRSTRPEMVIRVPGYECPFVIRVKPNDKRTVRDLLRRFFSKKSPRRLVHVLPSIQRWVLTSNHDPNMPIVALDDTILLSALVSQHKEFLSVPTWYECVGFENEDDGGNSEGNHDEDGNDGNHYTNTGRAHYGDDDDDDDDDDYDDDDDANKEDDNKLIMANTRYNSRRLNTNKKNPDTHKAIPPSRLSRMMALEMQESDFLNQQEFKPHTNKNNNYNEYDDEDEEESYTSDQGDLSSFHNSKHNYNPNNNQDENVYEEEDDDEDEDDEKRREEEFQVASVLSSDRKKRLERLGLQKRHSKYPRFDNLQQDGEFLDDRQDMNMPNGTEYEEDEDWEEEYNTPQDMQYNDRKRKAIEERYKHIMASSASSSSRSLPFQAAPAKRSINLRKASKQNSSHHHEQEAISPEQQHQPYQGKTRNAKPSKSNRH